MANIRAKSINELETWTPKELRKLRMTIRNRLTSFENSANPKELPASHPLYEMNAHQCQELLEKVLKAEKGR